MSSKIRDWSITIVALVVGFIVVGNQLGLLPKPSDPTHPQVPTAKQAGVAYRQALAKTHAQSLREFAADFEKGMPISDAMKKRQERWQILLSSEFDKSVKPGYDDIIPDGTPDSSITPGARSRYAAFARDQASAEEEVR
ncbi:MAG: hypothetical protein KGL39_45145 [Patescibacteria group bacterium]|nr:hypothetical protein [Patescibacteria group bacterium]